MYILYFHVIKSMRLYFHGRKPVLNNEVRLERGHTPKTKGRVQLRFPRILLMLYQEEEIPYSSDDFTFQLCDRCDRDAARSKFISCPLMCEMHLRTGFYDYYAACA